jgi:hypothetical protein
LIRHSPVSIVIPTQLMRGKLMNPNRTPTRKWSPLQSALITEKYKHETVDPNASPHARYVIYYPSYNPKTHGSQHVVH